MRERDGSMKKRNKRENREGNQQSKKIYSNRKKFQGFHPSPGSLMGKFAWRQFQSRPTQPSQASPPRSDCWVSKAKASRGQVQVRYPTCALGPSCTQYNARLTLGGRTPQLKQSCLPT